MKRVMLVGAVAAFTVGCSPSRWACYTPEDQTAGWKSVVIPKSMPALAAPEGIDQFRSGEPVILWRPQRVSGFEETTPRVDGQTTYRFRLEPGWVRAMEITFTQDLEGAKTDVVARTEEGGEFVVQSGERTRGSTARLRWNRPDAVMLEVTVHEHFRPKPVVHAWREASIETASVGSEARLVYRSPGGRSIELCSAEGRALESSEQPRDEPRETRIAPNMFARLNEKLSSQ